MKIGILGTADIAFRRFLPALQQSSGFAYAGVATRTVEKAKPFCQQFGGRVYDGYDAMLADESIDAIYLPLPPSLHYEWGKKTLQAGKHLLMEKPFTTTEQETKELLSLAQEKNLAVHENYMFLYHSQLETIKGLIKDGTLGQLRLIRATFGFPKRADTDFRYNKSLGGGALLDCGGYPIRLALELLGESARMVQASVTQPKDFEVDLFGSAVMENGDGICAQIAFGMDNSYRCELELWGSKATLIAPRIFTAPPELQPILELRGNETQIITLPQDNSFLNSLEKFYHIICFPENNRIGEQAKLVHQVQEKGQR